MRKRALIRGGAMAAGLAALAGAAAWLADQAAFVSTNDARVRTRMVTLSFEADGRIADVGITAGDRVDVGDTLARLETRKAELAVAQAVLDLKALEIGIARERLNASVTRAKGDRRIAASKAALEAASADVEAARAVLARSESDHRRAESLMASGFLARAAMERSDAALEVARQTALKAGAQAADRAAGVGESEAEARQAEVSLRNAEAMAASAHALNQRIELLKAELEDHVVTSPLNGVIDEVFAEAGEHVAAGTRLALMHEESDVWIEAHVKEPDLPRIALGAEVEIHLDAAKTPCLGTVERIGSATLSEFALIPNANPAGVFTKITQRVPVRITLGAECVNARPGAMASLRIRAS